MLGGGFALGSNSLGQLEEKAENMPAQPMQRVGQIHQCQVARRQRSHWVSTDQE